jgi:hypothetical protein
VDHDDGQFRIVHLIVLGAKGPASLARDTEKLEVIGLHNLTVQPERLAIDRDGSDRVGMSGEIRELRGRFGTARAQRA